MDVDQSLLVRARELGPLIREHMAEADRERRLSRAVIDALEQAGLTKLHLPKALGGLEADPITAMRISEEIAGFDAAAAWYLMVTNAGAFSYGGLPDAVVDEIMADRNWTSAASPSTPGVAHEVDGGYRVSGRVPFCSGVSTAKWVFLSYMVMDGDQPRMHQGAPVMFMACLPVSEVQIIDTWYGMGMRGTDSNDVAVRDLFVPKARTIPMVPNSPQNRYYQTPLYRLPMLAAIVLQWIPPIAIALGRRAIDEVKGLSAKRVPMATMVPVRERGSAQERLGRAEAMWRAARGLMYQTMSDLWEATLAGRPCTLDEKASGSLAAAHAAQTGVQVVDLMYTSAGSSAAFDSHPMQKLFRDAHVIRQHGFVCLGRYETFAQVALGLPPDLPFLHF